MKVSDPINPKYENGEDIIIPMSKTEPSLGQTKAIVVFTAYDTETTRNVCFLSPYAYRRSGDLDWSTFVDPIKIYRDESSILRRTCTPMM